MTKAPPIKTSTAIRDPMTGRILTVRGAGALKGKLTLIKGVDIIKPLASQVIKGGNLRKYGSPIPQSCRAEEG